MKKLMKLFNSLAEAPRGFAEWASLQMAWPNLKKHTPAGDGHPVLILPGFMTGDSYTTPLRNCLAEKGYDVHTWEGGINLGLSDKTAEHLRDHIEKIFAETSGKKITLIGHSLGGIYARELAREYPEMVRDVITLGTPLDLNEKTGATPESLRKLYEFINNGVDHFANPAMLARTLTPPPVPTTSIFSKSDGIVDWEASLNPASAQTENIEVFSGHLGLIVCPSAVAAVLDRLAQKEYNWKPFNAGDYANTGCSFGTPPTAAQTPKNPGWKTDPANSNPIFRKKK